MRGEIEWALVADAQHARVLEREVPGRSWREHTEMAVEINNRPSRERGSDRPGRTHESASTARHAIEPRTDPHRAAKHDFARHLADVLEEAATAGRYAQLLLVAPPAFLGDLRAELGDVARARLRGTLDKDLAKHPLGEVVELLEGVRPV
ncbi:host attachment protein [Falsiroseomonas sp.]|uniref:host attachment protein n=1 Tax=Falsiroseomonas sp. TaxID=2870721 RepID=UPI003569D125